MTFCGFSLHAQTDSTCIWIGRLQKIYTPNHGQLSYFIPPMPPESQNCYQPFVHCQRQMNELFYQCERKQHEENFQQLDSSFWWFVAFSSKLPDASLGVDWTRLKTVGNWADVCWCEERRMWHRLDAEASLLSKWRLLRACSINRDKLWCIWT